MTHCTACGAPHPKGWLLLPETATHLMHNAAAFGYVWSPARIDIDNDGTLRLVDRAPDWGRVYRLMVEAAPKLP